MEEKVLEAERIREELEQAQQSAEESIRLAEEAVNFEKAERELKATTIHSISLSMLLTCLLWRDWYEHVGVACRHSWPMGLVFDNEL